MIRGRWISVLAGIAALIAIPATGALAQEVESVLPLLGDADANKGKRLSLRCRACHDFSDNAKNKVGPPLWNVVGRAKATAVDYKYSNALLELGGEWTYDDLNAFLASPKDFAKGTKMKYAGMKKVEDRANLIVFLRSLSEEPAPLPVAGVAPTPGMTEVAARARQEVR